MAVINNRHIKTATLYMIFCSVFFFIFVFLFLFSLFLHNQTLAVRAIQILLPLENVVSGEDPKGAADRSDPPKQSSPLLGLDLVDPKMTGFTSTFLDGASISSFLRKYPILTSDAIDGILVIDHYRSTDTICMVGLL